MSKPSVVASELLEQTTNEGRGVPRVTLLIRAAKLISPHGEFICVIRDVSKSGIRLRGFHRLPADTPLELEQQSGERHRIEPVWTKGTEAGFRFVDPVEVAAVIAEVGRYPRRRLRIAIGLPVELRTIGQQIPAEVINMSQQGARIRCDSQLALAQPIMLLADDLPEVRARVRWRGDGLYGLAFDDTFSLRDFANLCAKLQYPNLLAD